MKSGLEEQGSARSLQALCPRHASTRGGRRPGHAARLGDARKQDDYVHETPAAAGASPHVRHGRTCAMAEPWAKTGRRRPCPRRSGGGAAAVGSLRARCGSRASAAKHLRAVEPWHTACAALAGTKATKVQMLCGDRSLRCAPPMLRATKWPQPRLQTQACAQRRSVRPPRARLRLAKARRRCAPPRGPMDAGDQGGSRQARAGAAASRQRARPCRARPDGGASARTPPRALAARTSGGRANKRAATGGRPARAGCHVSTR
jgi:hypothetical protein